MKMDKLQNLICLIIGTLIAFLASCTTAGHIGYHGAHDYYAYPKYAYKYGVQDKYTGDFKTAHEERDGPITRGSYSVLQPDGILRTVKYWVDPKGGFQATVINKATDEAVGAAISRIKDRLLVTNIC